MKKAKFQFLEMVSNHTQTIVYALFIAVFFCLFVAIAFEISLLKN